MADSRIGGAGPKFLQFDVVSDCSDHDYNDYTSSAKNEDCFAISSSANKRIVQEWKILKKHLPGSIYVRVYESRMNLLRAVIIGAPGTPYHDGLFFFDLLFPSDYPSRPPRVSYRSFGMRLNPNLYSNGKVCLSLLNTWTGKNCEKWNQSESTVLQVLLSIQALVLNEKPYYNEPYNMPLLRHMHENRSASYSFNAFVLSCKTMLNLMKNPPKNFENFVSSHFRLRGRVILDACRSYVNGESKLGFYGYGESSSSSSVAVPSHFRESMQVLYPKMMDAFAGKGCYLRDCPLDLYIKEGAAMAKRKKSLVKLITANVKKLLGLRRKKKINKKTKGNADRIEPAPDTE